MGDDIDLINAQFFGKLKDLGLESLRVILDCSEAIDLAFINLKSFAAQNTVNLPKGLQKEDVFDGDAMHQNDWILGVHENDNNMHTLHVDSALQATIAFR